MVVGPINFVVGTLGFSGEKGSIVKCPLNVNLVVLPVNI